MLPSKPPETFSLVGIPLSVDWDLDVTPKEQKVTEKGGIGSGNFGHQGRPGKVGGSAETTDYSMPPDSVNIRQLMAGSPDGLAIGKYHSYLPIDERVNDLLNKDLKDPEDWIPLREKWAAISRPDRVSIKMKISREIAERVEDSHVSYWTASDALESWAGSSNDSSWRSLSLQEAASEEFGVKMSDWQSYNWESTKANDNIAREAVEFADHTRRAEGADTALRMIKQKYKINQDNPPKWYESVRSSIYETDEDWKGEISKYIPVGNRQQERALLRAMYDNTQEALKAGVTSSKDNYVTLYRGVNRSAFENVPNQRWLNHGMEGRIIKYAGNAMESWSVSPSIAANFGSVILAARVPRKNILSTAKTGFGCMKEGEVVILGMNNTKVTTAFVSINDSGD